MFWRNFVGGHKWRPPCIEIRKVDLDYEETDDDLIKDDEILISLYFISSSYKEIRQTRAYTVMTLVGNVGGIFGLLLGYALVQIPSCIQEALQFFKQKYVGAKNKTFQSKLLFKTSNQATFQK